MLRADPVDFTSEVGSLFDTRVGGSASDRRRSMKVCLAWDEGDCEAAEATSKRLARAQMEVGK